MIFRYYTLSTVNTKTSYFDLLDKNHGLSVNAAGYTKLNLLKPCHVIMTHDTYGQALLSSPFKRIKVSEEGPSLHQIPAISTMRDA